MASTNQGLTLVNAHRAAVAVIARAKAPTPNIGTLLGLTRLPRANATGAAQPMWRRRSVDSIGA